MDARTDAVTWLMGARPRTKRSSREFRDADGQPVRVGDVVDGHIVNTRMRGRVIRLERDRTLKPFVIQGFGSPQDCVTWYSHREYIRKRQPRKEG